MVYVNPKKKLNRFRNVSIPSNKDLFFRVGLRPNLSMPDGQVADFSSSTMDQLDAAMGTLLNKEPIPSEYH